MIVYGVWQSGGSPSALESEHLPEMYVGTLREARVQAKVWIEDEAMLAQEREHDEESEEDRAARLSAFGAAVRVTRYTITRTLRGRALALALLNGKRWVRERKELEGWRMSGGCIEKFTPKKEEAGT